MGTRFEGRKEVHLYYYGMKKLLLIVALTLAVTVGASAKGGVEFREGTLDEMVAEAAAADKYLFVELFATWCGPCRVMERTLATDEVGEFMNPRFVSVRYDVDKATGSLLARANGVRSIPTCLVINGNGEVVGRLVGLSTPERFIASMQRLLENVAAEK